MTKAVVDPSVQVELVSASVEQQSIVANLLELYAHDFSEFHEIELGDDGRFGYKSLPLYWSEPNRHPSLVGVDGKLAGFVFVKRGSEISCDETVWDMAEFFVMRAYRRSGIGTRIAREVWRRFPGEWEVRVMQANVSAHRFWEQAIAAFIGNPVHSSGFEMNGERWRIFCFVSAPRIATNV
jgi:predicted acetyltransferase